MRGRAYQSNFSMGILDEEAHGRVDLQVYVSALGDCQNAIPSTLGSARRRAGFIDEGAPKSQTTPCELIPFRRSAGDQLVLEFGDDSLRIWNANGAPVLDSGEPYEITSPYPSDTLGQIRFDQSNDVLYLAHRSRTLAPRALQRRGQTDWAFVTLTNKNGPWRAENSDDTHTMAASGLTGPVTLTSSKAYFAEAMIGERLRLRTANGQPGCGSWTPATDYHARELIQSDGKLYFGPSADKKSGTAAPLHDRGTVSDGAMDWTFLSDGAGVVRITAVSSPTEATGIVEAPLPGWTVDGDRSKVLDPAATPFLATTRWAEGAWSERYGWPADVALTDDDRLAFSGSASEPGVYHLTRTSGYGPDWADFSPGLGSGRVTDDDAIRRAIRGGGDPIEWLIAAGPLMFGTTSRSGVIMATSLEEPLSPADNRGRSLGGDGCADVRPAMARDGVLFIARGGRALNFIKASSEEGVVDADLTLFVEDLMAERIVGMAWAPNPDKVCWLWTAQGSLLSCTWQPRQNQFGWARHPLPGGFKVESACVITDGDGRDMLWLAVHREKNGEPQRRIWRQAARWRDGDPLEAICYLDACRFYTGEPVTKLGGMEHLAGETVRVFGNRGALIFDAVVSEAGEVDVPDGQTVTHACAGLRYGYDVESVPLDIGGPGETAGALQNVKNITVYLADCVHAEVAFGDGPLEEEGGKPWGDDPKPHTQVFKASVGGTTTRDARWRVFTDDCWPITLRAVRAAVTVDD